MELMSTTPLAVRIAAALLGRVMGVSSKGSHAGRWKVIVPGTSSEDSIVGAAEDGDVGLLLSSVLVSGIVMSWELVAATAATAAVVAFSSASGSMIARYHDGAITATPNANMNMVHNLVQAR